MSVVAFVQASKREEVDGQPGVLVTMSFRKDGEVGTLDLEGVVDVTAEGEIGSVTVTVDELALSNEENTSLISAGAQACWKALFRHDHVAAGLMWRPLRSWIRGFDPTSTAAIEAKIAIALTSSPL